MSNNCHNQSQSFVNVLCCERERYSALLPKYILRDQRYLGVSILNFDQIVGKTSVKK